MNKNSIRTYFAPDADLARAITAYPASRGVAPVLLPDVSTTIDDGNLPVEPTAVANPRRLRFWGARPAPQAG